MLFVVMVVDALNLIAEFLVKFDTNLIILSFNHVSICLCQLSSFGQRIPSALNVKNWDATICNTDTSSELHTAILKRNRSTVNAKGFSGLFYKHGL